MKTLARLEREACEQDDPINHPRDFMAVFPSGLRLGCFLDPFFGIMEIKDIGVVTMQTLKNKGCDPEEIPAHWVGEES